MPVDWCRSPAYSTCEIAWHTWDMGLTSVAARGIVPVAATCSAGIVAWRISYRHKGTIEGPLLYWEMKRVKS